MPAAFYKNETFFIYCIENTINGKIYIGKTNDPKERWSCHKTIARGGKKIYKKQFQIIHSAMIKYDISNFNFFVMSAYNSEKEALCAEIDWILYLRNNNIKIYNLTDGGEGISGYHHTDETKLKITQSSTGRKHTEQAKQLMSIKAQNRPPSYYEEQILNLKITNTGRKHTEETKQKVSLASTGRLHTPETKRKISINKAKLSEKQIIFILKEWKEKSNNFNKSIKLFHQKLLKQFNIDITYSNLKAILGGRTWKFLFKEIMEM